MMRANTQAISIEAQPSKVMKFLADGRNLPRWAVGFAKSVEPDGARWIVTTGAGEMLVSIDTDPACGVVDFRMTPAPVVFTQFHLAAVAARNDTGRGDLCEVEPAAFRQRLSRARRALEAFTRSYRGLVDESAPCRCDRRVARAEELGRLHRDRPVLAVWPAEQVDRAVREMESLHDAAIVFRNRPAYRAPEAVLARVRNAIALSASPPAPLPDQPL